MLRQVRCDTQTEPQSVHRATPVRTAEQATVDDRSFREGLAFLPQSTNYPGSIIICIRRSNTKSLKRSKTQNHGFR